MQNQTNYQAKSPTPLVNVKDDRNRQIAFKWAILSLVRNGQSIVLVLVHVVNTKGGTSSGKSFNSFPCTPCMWPIDRPFLVSGVEINSRAG
ncbi:hypothetical protein EJB05_27375, partial [Eragrostis curvula]